MSAATKKKDSRRLWQITSENNWGWFQHCGMALLGPSELGDFRTAVVEFGRMEDEPTPREWFGAESLYDPLIQTFAKEVKPGDGILLIGKSPYGGFGNEIQNVGFIAESNQQQPEIIRKNGLIGAQASRAYFYTETLDLKGIRDLDLHHGLRAHWQKNPSSRHFSPEELFEDEEQRNTPPSFSEVGRRCKKVWEYAQPILDFLKEQVKDKKLPDLPPDAPAFSKNDLMERLIVNGVSSQTADLCTGTISRLQGLLQWYKATHVKPRTGDDEDSSDREDYWVPASEVGCHLVLPLLRGLGWCEQQIGVSEDGTYLRLSDQGIGAGARDPRYCRILVDVRSPEDTDIRNTFERAWEYKEKKDLRRCEGILLTDGRHYRLVPASAKGVPAGEVPTSFYMCLDRVVDIGLILGLMPQSFA